MGSSSAKSDSTVVDFTIESLRDAIREGRLAPGQRLVVADVTRMLGVSAGPVREAIRRLTGEGLIEIVPHRGASVRRITLSDIEEIFQLRGAIEGLAARLAAENDERGDLVEEMDRVVDEMTACAENQDAERYLETNTAFHDLIYRMAGNERLRNLASQLVMPLYQVRLPHRMSKESMAISFADHLKIADALRKGDGDQAEAAMRDHVAQAGVGLKDALEASTPRLRAGRDASAEERR